MKRRFRDYLWNLVLVAPVMLAGGGAALALTPSQEACNGIGGTLNGTNCVVTGASGAKGDLGEAFKAVANTLIFIVLAVSTIMVIIGGLRYVLSTGDSAGVKSAKDTIMYALIGVAVAIIAYALVRFVVNAIK